MKKSYLIEIIREEITAVLNEKTIDVQGDPNRLTPQQQQHSQNVLSHRGVRVFIYGNFNKNVIRIQHMHVLI